MTDINFENKHPRGEAGKFAAKEGEAANVSLTAPENTDPKVERSGDDLNIILADGTEVEYTLTDANASHIDVKAVELENGDIEVRWAALDDTGLDFNFTEGDDLTRFDSAYARDEHIENLLAEGVKPEQIFIAERFEHSVSNYKVLADWNEWSADQTPERSRVSDRWDSAPSVVIVVDKGDVGGVTDYRASADAVAEEYTSWANGDVYGLYRATIDQDGDEVEPPEATWNIVGTEYAEQYIESGDY